MTRPMKHMTLNVTLLAAVYAALWAVQATEPARDVALDLGECEASATQVDYAAMCDKTPPAGLNDMILKAAHEYQVDPTILASTVYRESKCDKNALGTSGEIGLGQVHPKVWLEDLKEHGILKREKDLYKPLTNLRASAYILSTLAHRADTARDLFRMYNGSGKQAHKYADEQMVAYRETWGKTPEI